MRVPSYIYFLCPEGAEGPIKIGCSEFPAFRLKTYSAWSPVPLRIVATAPGRWKEEQALHAKFVADHSHGEWFRSSPALWGVIRKINLGASVVEALGECAFPEKRVVLWRKQREAASDARALSHGIA